MPTSSSGSTCRTGRSSSPNSTTRCAPARTSRRRIATSSRSASPRSTSANGRWIIAACSHARCARSATPRSAIPELTRHLQDTDRRRFCAAEDASPSARQPIGKRHDQVWAKWQEEARKDWDASPITFSRLAMEIWEVIKDEDWVLTANNLKHQVRKLWDFDKPYRYAGRRTRHLDADRHLARRGAGPPRQRTRWWSTSSPTAT